ncbi:MAG TPA: adenylate/guanylate cyclase domain-containing protein [bacterium]|nr:adenylate/guanylate cyclase domain-containing protein [bacterium]
MENRHETIGNKDSKRNLHLLIIASEMVIFFVIIYFSVYRNWHQHDILRYMILIPIYQAGVYYGLTGGTIVSFISTLLFLPLIPVDTLLQTMSYGVHMFIVMLFFFVFFGIYIGATLGNDHKTQRYIDGLSIAMMNIARAVDARDAMLTLAGESLGIVDTMFAAVCIDGTANENHSAEILMIDGQNREPQSLEHIPADNALVIAAREELAIVSNSIAVDTRLQSLPRGELLKTAAIVPVAIKDRSIGSLLVCNKKNGDSFTENDYAVLQMLAESAAGTILNIEQERERQEEQLREEQMKELFSRYVSTSIADFVLKNPEMMKGHWQEVTILVSDVRDFTKISETLSSKEIVRQLNEYFTRMVDVILDHKGTIDKFVGDCIIAYWGAPAPDPEHPLNAARAAVAMAGELDLLNMEWQAQNRPQFKAGIALHTCNVLIGSIGDERKKAFTIMGEEVENAIHIESMTKSLNAGIILTDETCRAIENSIDCELISNGSEPGTRNLYKIKIGKE